MKPEDDRNVVEAGMAASTLPVKTRIILSEMSRHFNFEKNVSRIRSDRI